MNRNKFTIYDDNENTSEDLCFIMDDFDIKTKNVIIAIADMGLWNGRKQGYKILGENIKDIFSVNEDNNKYYCDGKDLKAVCVHHDGTNYITFREFKDISQTQIYNFLRKITSNQPLTYQQLHRYTSSLVKYLD